MFTAIIANVFYILFSLLSLCHCELWTEADLEGVESEVVNWKLYRYMTSIVRAKHGVCTGSLFTRQYVLTSATCSFGHYDDITKLPVPEDKSSFELRLKSDLVDSGGALQTILHIYIHPRFRSVDSQTQYDISIFKIVWIFFLGSSLSLAPANYLNNKKAKRLIGSKTKCETVGWGYVEVSDSKPVSPELRRVDVVIVPWNTCTPLNNLSSNKSGEFCGIIPNKTCFLSRGSGSPLLCNDEMVGVASWGSRCGTEHQPLIFTRLDSWVMPFVRTRSAQRRSFDYSLSSKIEAPHIVNLLIFISYPLFISLAHRYKYFSNYI